MLIQPCNAVSNTEGVDWDNPSTSTFVQSVYMAIYGSAPNTTLSSKYASELKSRGDRYRFAKWLMVQPEYQRAFGSPRGQYLVCHTIDRKKFTVSKTIPPGYHEAVERNKAFGPAMLLKTYWDPNHKVAAKPTKPISKPAAGPITVDGLLGTYEVFHVGKYKHGIEYKKWGFITFGPTRGKGHFIRNYHNGKSSRTRIHSYEVKKDRNGTDVFSLINIGGLGSWLVPYKGNLQQFEVEGQTTVPTLGGMYNIEHVHFRFVRQ